MRIEDDGTGVRVATGGGVFLTFIYGPPTVERLEWLARHEEEMMAAYPRFSALQVVDIGVGRNMTSEARTKARDIADHFDSRLLASVTVVPGTGFFPAMVRSVVAGIQLISRRKSEWQVCSSVEEGLRFIADVHRRAQVPLDSDDAAAAMRALLPDTTTPQRSAG